MNINVITIFPEIFSGFLCTSLIGKAQDSGAVKITLRNIRDYADPPHFSVDDAPYGGGPGMVMKPEPLTKAIRGCKDKLARARVVLLSPAGTPLTQERCKALSKEQELILVCGRYEGVDQRVIESCVDEEISIGDYIVMGGEVAAMVLIEAIARLLPMVVGNPQSTQSESFGFDLSDPLLLEAPQYTRPAVFEGNPVPEVLLSGDHAKIAAWRKEKAISRTKERRPELLK